MRRLHARLAAACALAVATAIFTGTAVAGGNGNGNSANAPGQQKQEQAQPAPQASQPAAQSNGSSSSSSSSSSAGVKPSSGTTHWTHCTTGTSSAGATCTSSDSGHTPQTKADVSKHYGNGKTAAQIATSRGGVGVQLTGPGNSQPHKVAACGKKSNKSGGVDVHAIKSYSASACTSSTTSTTPTTTTPTTTTPVKAHEDHKVTICHATGSATNPYVEITVDEHALKNGHTTAKGDIIPAPSGGCPTATSTVTATTPQVVAPPTTTTTTTTVAVAPTTTTTVTVTTPTTTTTAGSVAGTVTTTTTPTTTTTAASGGVLGAQTSLATPKPASHHGVLGTVTHIAGGTLPFTGFPVWLAMVIALALILAGIALRRRTMGGARL